jgi:drug/metabolite transporter superfamily protein YnfA
MKEIIFFALGAVLIVAGCYSFWSGRLASRGVSINEKDNPTAWLLGTISYIIIGIAAIFLASGLL